MLIQDVFAPHINLVTLAAMHGPMHVQRQKSGEKDVRLNVLIKRRMKRIVSATRCSCHVGKRYSKLDGLCFYLVKTLTIKGFVLQLYMLNV